MSTDSPAHSKSSATSPAPSKVSAALAKNKLGVFAVGFFIMAGVAPLTVTEGVVPTAYGVTGLTSVPAAFLVVAVVLAISTVGYLAMSRHITNAGAFYAFVARGLGRPAGVGAALVAVVAYNLLQVGLYGMIGPQMASYASDNFGIQAPWGVWAFSTWAVVTVLGLVRVDRTGRVLGVLATIELLIIVALTVSGLAHPAAAGGISISQLSPTSLHLGSLGAVLAVAVLGFVGFEQGPVYSEEARNAKRTIATATYVALGLIAIIYAAASWALDVHYGDQVVPMAQGPGGSEMLFAMAPGLLSSVGRTLFLTSLLAAALAFHSAVGRYMWALGRERVLPSALGATSGGVPRVASGVQSLLGAVAILLAIGLHWSPVNQLFFWGGTTGGLGILLLLAATSAAVVKYFLVTPNRESAWHRLLAPGISTVALAAMAWLCIDHFDLLLNVAPGSTPTVILPGLFGIAAVIGVAWALVLKRQHPDAYQKIGLGNAVTVPSTAATSPAPATKGTSR